MSTIINDTTTDEGATGANTTAKAVIRADISEITSSLARTTLQANQPYIFLNTAISVADVVEELFELPADPPSLYLDLEGTNLSRHGSISILQISVLPHNRTYLIDIHMLKENAFAKAASNGQTLKKLLETESVPKVFFDVRNNADALYNCFGITLAGVQDLQLMELATRNFSKKYVHGLAKCIENDAPMTLSERNAWKLGKEKGLKLFAPERGGSYEVFNVWPLALDILRVVQDILELYHTLCDEQRRIDDEAFYPLRYNTRRQTPLV
ncbi:hypothetical protein BDV27DRAFT_161282 [Aspergillus caelatus]|uniref:3'-5' exonuclease domain-containing protein n=1 Tax=Aspergillus caelatus TaxID=61420 RepID=A0A5N6ZUC4_9EURO|nr:uncharacterized protein BDV27DRAFT_161282 [Aspergillus caelatus]KAE8360863.1 hypothetical protein BDV27DRAFT_161282 [Aspergillus caelatus]